MGHLFLPFLLNKQFQSKNKLTLQEKNLIVLIKGDNQLVLNRMRHMISEIRKQRTILTKLAMFQNHLIFIVDKLVGFKKMKCKCLIHGILVVEISFIKRHSVLLHRTSGKFPVKMKKEDFLWIKVILNFATYWKNFKSISVQTLHAMNGQKTILKATQYPTKHFSMSCMSMERKIWLWFMLQFKVPI